jgi:hypothetical protein
MIVEAEKGVGSPTPFSLSGAELCSCAFSVIDGTSCALTT